MLEMRLTRPSSAHKRLLIGCNRFVDSYVLRLFACRSNTECWSGDLSTGPDGCNVATIASRSAGTGKLRHRLTVLVFLLPWLIGFSALFVFAIAQSVGYSFTNYNLLNDPKWVGLGNYRALFADAVFWETFGNTLFFVVTLVPGMLALSFVLAVLVDYRSRASGFATIALFLPFVVPLAATALVWRWIFNAEYGVMNYVLSLVGVDGPSWLLDRNWVKPAIWMAEMTLIGQYFLIFVASLQTIPKSLYESADLEGANGFRKMISITVPMASPAILFNLVTSFIIVFQTFDIPYMISLNAGATMQAKAFGGPGWSSTTYAMYIYHKMFNEYDAGLASASAVVAFVVVCSASVLLMRTSNRLVHYEN